jgi:hypothetical protein
MVQPKTLLQSIQQQGGPIESMYEHWRDGEIVAVTWDLNGESMVTKPGMWPDEPKVLYSHSKKEPEYEGFWVMVIYAIKQYIPECEQTPRRYVLLLPVRSVLVKVEESV